MLKILEVTGAVVFVYLAIRVAATVVDVYKDWRNGWPKWKAGDPEA